MTTPPSRHAQGESADAPNDPYAGRPYRPTGWNVPQPDEALQPLPPAPVMGAGTSYEPPPISYPRSYSAAPVRRNRGRRIFFRFFAFGLLIAAAAWCVQRFNGAAGLHTGLVVIALTSYAVAILVGLPWWLVDAFRARPRGLQLVRTLVAAVVVAGVVAGIGAVGVAALHQPKSSVSGPDETASAPTAVRLTAMLPQLSDLPGWTTFPTPTGEASDSNSVVPECGRTSTTNSDIVASATSPGLQSGTTVAFGSATSYRSTRDVDADRIRLSASSMPSCAQTVFLAGLRHGLAAAGTVAGPTFNYAAGPAFGIANIAATANGTVQVIAANKTNTVYFALVLILSRQTEALTIIESVGTPISASTQQSLLTPVAARIAAG